MCFCPVQAKQTTLRRPHLIQIDLLAGPWVRCSVLPLHTGRIPPRRGEEHCEAGKEPKQRSQRGEKIPASMLVKHCFNFGFMIQSFHDNMSNQRACSNTCLGNNSIPNPKKSLHSGLDPASRHRNDKHSNETMLPVYLVKISSEKTCEMPLL